MAQRMFGRKTSLLTVCKEQTKNEISFIMHEIYLTVFVLFISHTWVSYWIILFLGSCTENLTRKLHER
jgi:hypothetical protein